MLFHSSQVIVLLMAIIFQLNVTLEWRKITCRKSTKGPNVLHLQSSFEPFSVAYYPSLYGGNQCALQVVTFAELATSTLQHTIYGKFSELIALHIGSQVWSKFVTKLMTAP